MNDMMTFPDTVEEFMEQYKITDTKQVYTNGIEFVPIFRMKQWFEHLPSAQPEIIRCRDCKYMTEHYDTDGNVPYWTCSEWDSGTDYDGFCHYAERRTDERQT